MLEEYKPDYATKRFQFKVDEIDESGEGTFTGYASTFGNVDLGGDVVEKGAFKRTIDHTAGVVPVLWSHNPYIPAIGQGMDMSEDEKGLWIKAQLNLDVQLAKDVYSNMKRGITKGLSIGYDIVQDEFDRKNGVRRLKEIKLWEYSIVTFPMNPAAATDNVKAKRVDDTQLYSLIGWASSELKAGRVLSERNRNLVSSAVEALNALLGVESTSDSSDNSDDDEKSIVLANDVTSLVEQIKSFRIPSFS